MSRPYFQFPRSWDNNCRESKMTLRALRFRAEYRLLNWLQTPFGYVFWALEQRKAALDIRIEEKRAGDERYR